MPQLSRMIWMNSPSFILPLALLARSGVTGSSAAIPGRVVGAWEPAGGEEARLSCSDSGCGASRGVGTWVAEDAEEEDATGSGCVSRREACPDVGTPVVVEDAYGCPRWVSGDCNGRAALSPLTVRGAVSAGRCPRARPSTRRYNCSIFASASRIRRSRSSALAPTGTGTSISMVCVRPPVVNCVL